MLVERIAESCGIDRSDAENELECVVGWLKAGVEEDHLTYDTLTDMMEGLGLDITDDNVDAILMRLLL